jgi:hypothetical protein
MNRKRFMKMGRWDEFVGFSIWLMTSLTNQQKACRPLGQALSLASKSGS